VAPPFLAMSFERNCTRRMNAKADPATSPADPTDPTATRLDAALSRLWSTSTSIPLVARSLFDLCHHDLPTARAALAEHWARHLAPHYPAVLRDMASGELERLAGLDRLASGGP